jgi:hypothetical protein
MNGAAASSIEIEQALLLLVEAVNAYAGCVLCCDIYTTNRRGQACRQHLLTMMLNLVKLV